MGAGIGTGTGMAEFLGNRTADTGVFFVNCPLGLPWSPLFFFLLLCFDAHGQRWRNSKEGRVYFVSEC